MKNYKLKITSITALHHDTFNSTTINEINYTIKKKHLY